MRAATSAMHGRDILRAACRDRVRAERRRPLRRAANVASRHARAPARVAASHGDAAVAASDGDAAVAASHGDVASSLGDGAADRVRLLVEACSRASAGLGTCAKHARDASVADATQALATEQDDLVAELRAAAARSGIELRGPRAKGSATTTERLRWEWLASTAALLDGAPDVRLLDECARATSAAQDLAASLRGAPEAIAAVVSRALAAFARARASLTTMAAARA